MENIWHPSGSNLEKCCSWSSLPLRYCREKKITQNPEHSELLQGSEETELTLESQGPASAAPGFRFLCSAARAPEHSRGSISGFPTWTELKMRCPRSGGPDRQKPRGAAWLPAPGGRLVLSPSSQHSQTHSPWVSVSLETKGFPDEGKKGCMYTADKFWKRKKRKRAQQ